MTKKIIIFGAAGNIGVYFLDYLLNNIDLTKYQIIAVGRTDSYKYSFFEGDYYKVDIRNKEDFEKLPKSNVKAVVDFAGVLPAYSNEVSPQDYIDVNVSGTLNILEYCKKVQADRIIYTTSWADLNGYLEQEKPLEPYSPLKPILTGDHAVYCASKNCAVGLINCYHKMYGISSFIFRLPNIYMYSPDQYYFVNGEKKLISYRYIINRAIKGESIELWGNPKKGKDIIYVKDLCQMIYKSIFTHHKYGIYNAGTGKKTTMQEQIEGIIEVFSQPDNKSKIVYRPDKKDCDDFVMNIDNIIADLGYMPEYDYISYLKDYKKEMELKRFWK